MIDNIADVIDDDVLSILEAADKLRKRDNVYHISAAMLVEALIAERVAMTPHWCCQFDTIEAETCSNVYLTKPIEWHGKTITELGLYHNVEKLWVVPTQTKGTNDEQLERVC